MPCKWHDFIPTNVETIDDDNFLTLSLNWVPRGPLLGLLWPPATPVPPGNDVTAFQTFCEWRDMGRGGERQARLHRRKSRFPDVQGEDTVHIQKDTGTCKDPGVTLGRMIPGKWLIGNEGHGPSLNTWGSKPWKNLPFLFASSKKCCKQTQPLSLT